MHAHGEQRVPVQSSPRDCRRRGYRSQFPPGPPPPQVPDPAPLPSFRGQPLTHELAEDLFIGWLRDPSSQLAPGRELFSWRVFGGKNPA